MAHREIAAGSLISLANTLGQEPLSVAVFADRSTPAARDLTEFWNRQG